MTKPHWFRVSDWVALALGSVLGVAMLSLLVIHEAPAKHIIGFCFVLAMFIGVWSYYGWRRQQWLDKFIWYPTYGLFVHPENFLMPSAQEVDDVVRRTILRWRKVHPMAERIVKSDVVWVFFRKRLDETEKNPARRKVEGFWIAGSRTLYVDYDSRYSALEQTAFRHELGHLIHGLATGNWSMKEHHEFMAEHGLESMEP